MGTEFAQDVFIKDRREQMVTRRLAHKFSSFWTARVTCGLGRSNRSHATLLVPSTPHAFAKTAKLKLDVGPAIRLDGAAFTR